MECTLKIKERLLWNETSFWTHIISEGEEGVYASNKKHITGNAAVGY